MPFDASDVNLLLIMWSGPCPLLSPNHRDFSKPRYIGSTTTSGIWISSCRGISEIPHEISMPCHSSDRSLLFAQPLMTERHTRSLISNPTRTERHAVLGKRATFFRGNCSAAKPQTAPAIGKMWQPPQRLAVLDWLIVHLASQCNRGELNWRALTADPRPSHWTTSSVIALQTRMVTHSSRHRRR